jgi:hypothetical protein
MESAPDMCGNGNEKPWPILSYVVASKTRVGLEPHNT